MRERLYAQWYRGKMLERVGGTAFLRREPQYRRRLYEEIRRLALERYGPEIEGDLPFNLRVRVTATARRAATRRSTRSPEFESQLRADVKVRRVSGDHGELSIEVEASLGSEPGPSRSREEELGTTGCRHSRSATSFRRRRST